jgi:hypothetical protein
MQAEYLPINEIAFDMYLKRNTSLPMKMIKNKATKGTNNQLSKYRFIAITKASNDIINSISCHQVVTIRLNQLFLYFAIYTPKANMKNHPVKQCL